MPTNPIKTGIPRPKRFALPCACSLQGLVILLDEAVSVLRAFGADVHAVPVDGKLLQLIVEFAVRGVLGGVCCGDEGKDGEEVEEVDGFHKGM